MDAYRGCPRKRWAVSRQGGGKCQGKGVSFELWLTFFAEGCDARFQLGAASYGQSCKGFKGALDFFALGGVDQHFGD